MPSRKICKISIVVIALLFLTIVSSYAFEDDGFGSAKKVESKHFIVYYSPQLDTADLAQQLNIRPADELLVGKTPGTKDSFQANLADMLDTLFIRVCNILYMNLYSFRGNIKICRDYNQMNRVYNTIFDKDLKDRKSFYVYDSNTIYISSDNFKREILGHEIAHAVISHYFGVLPSVKIQEVLAGYVEYQLRKTGQ